MNSVPKISRSRGILFLVAFFPVVIAAAGIRPQPAWSEGARKLDEVDATIKYLESKGHTVHRMADGTLTISLSENVDHGNGIFYSLPKLSPVSCLILDGYVLGADEIRLLSTSHLSGELKCYDCKLLSGDLGTLRNVKSLEFFRCDFRGDLLSGLGKCQKLELLRLHSTKLAAEGVLNLPKQMSTKMDVVVDDTNLNFDSFRNICTRPYVKQINISEAGIVDDYVENLELGESLTSLSIGGKLSDKPIQRLKDANPEVHIIWGREDDK
ncbi:hypothetical protein [Bremerella cremea]|uniref:hypothetical protein n=1 Tax=Bremerella cremea TaxID=1031537 RepID=UPI0031EC627D